MRKLLAQHIRAHVREYEMAYGTSDNWGRILRGLTVESWKVREVVQTMYEDENGRRMQLVKYDVVTTFKAKAGEPDHAMWSVGIYQNDGWYVYFDKRF